MTPEEHYLAAEEELAKVEEAFPDREINRQHLARAQVHATLATCGTSEQS